MNDPNPTPIKDLSYEAAFAELESIVDLLEQDSGDLQEALRLFERGQALSQHCSSLLDHAELKIKLLTGESLDEFEAED